MAIIDKRFLSYLSNVLTKSMNTKKAAFLNDPLFVLLESSNGVSTDFREDFISTEKVEKPMRAFPNDGVIGVIKNYFKGTIINPLTDQETERKIIALKTGFPRLPATTCSIVMQGFGHHLSERDILSVYASHGLARGMKDLLNEFDFTDINRRVREFDLTLRGEKEHDKFVKRYNVMCDYLQAPRGKQEEAIRNSGIKRSLFFYYWKLFCRYGVLGLFDSGKELFRNGKIGMKNEAKVIVSKLQYPKKSNLSFVNMLSTKNIYISSSALSMIFKRWKLNEFDSKFTDNLKRLENELPEENVKKETELQGSVNPIRYVDEYYFATLKGLKEYGMPTDSPGLFLIWAYIEKLGVFPILEQMGLTLSKQKKGYCWLELFLFNVGRIFYGVASYSAACNHPEPSIAFFSGLVKAPCNDSFLNGLAEKITEEETYNLRKWLVKRASELELIDMKKIAMDFHQIDMDVLFDRLRKFGKGPSSKKKICYNAFRPHIAWDVGTGCLIAAEFRKGSARGTTTAIPFIKDYMLSEYGELFETVYVDSEYTGKKLWQFILDENAMNADMTACLKQNVFVKKHRDLFLKEHQSDPCFWKYYDEKHVYSSITFDLPWKDQSGEKEHVFSLNCVVKKNINSGKLRCFGTSKKELESKAILIDYSNRWVIENGIKDLIGSYYLDNCPGTRPHLADVHFLIISVCRMLYKMIENDLGKDIKNSDGTVKTMSRMRDLLFRQGAGTVFFRNDTFEVQFQNSYSPVMTKMLKQLFKHLGVDKGKKLKLLGDAKLKFLMKIPFGEEHRNSLEKVPLFMSEKFQESSK